MSHSPLLTRSFVLGLTYFAAASLTISLTRYDGGVAFLWIGSSLLIAELMVRPRRQWRWPLLACAAASVAATGLFGFGWALALPFMAINLVEGWLAASILRRHGRGHRPLESLAWLLQFVIAVGVIAPLVAAALAAATLLAIDRPPDASFVNFFTGHALGGITFAPLALLIARGSLRQLLKDVRRRDSGERAALLMVMIATSVVVFRLDSLSLLFLPVLPIILVTFRLGRSGAAVAIVVLALVGGGATIAGLGPIHLVATSPGGQMMFFQFYLAATVLTVLPVAADLQNRNRLHRAMRLSEERYRLLAEHSTDILLQLEVDGRIRFVSPSIRQLGGYEPEALIGLNCRILIAPEHLERVREAHHAIAAAAGETQTYEYLALTADGTRRWFETNGRAILDEHGEIDSVLSVARDISARKAVERRLTADALTDPLTGLPNRRGFNAVVSRRPVEAAVNRGDCIAVLDLDHFKVINDSFGHDVGDAVLRRFATIARAMVRDRDLVARIGGEEFAIFFPDTPVDQAMLVCDRLRCEMAQMEQRAGTARVRVTVSGGVAEVGPEGIDHALKVADLALYEAKRNGRDQFTLAA
ncbi:MAG: diguanylate cyclase [Pseudomonadota bacterium]|nr:diguanylate cyclase [Pseudomonadota bacterium]